MERWFSGFIKVNLKMNLLSWNDHKKGEGGALDLFIYRSLLS